MRTDSERLIEITHKSHPDVWALRYCASVLQKEAVDILPHLTHLSIIGQHVYATDGASARKALLKEHYPPGLYRVFRKARRHVIIYRSDHQLKDYPTVSDMFDLDGTENIGDVTLTENYWHGHAAVTQAISAKEAFSAEFLKGVEGIFGLFMNGRTIILDNNECSVAIMPLQVQEKMPFNEGESNG